MAKHISDLGVRDWRPERLPDLTGKIHFITGGNSGLGLETAKMLAEKNADIIIAARNPDKAKQAAEIVRPLGTGFVETAELDLASLDSVRACAEDMRTRFPELDSIINNAGIMQTPQSETAEGFELQFGTNHLGHFLLNALMVDMLEARSGRIVVVSSIAHKYGQLNFDDLMHRDGYTPTKAYTQSKLANLVYAFELDRTLAASGSKVTAYACHPGYSNTNLQSTGPRSFWRPLYKILNPLLAQDAAQGAIPTVLAAAGEEAKRGAYYGPQSMSEARGRVSDALVADQALDENAAARLWRESETLTGMRWPQPAPA
ncbi:oxidoreductase [Maricaulis sp.]|uniref:oxidoreductase n=1 Tax=Maricaulis sp. TaxID=1486257 RepID=UPI001B104933|nr:oxidoreductase [Maricaulis sp.]MBO6796472.1 SDR family NAD(P)-dependent oxidoreductase [Maricaulis sp.]